VTESPPMTIEIPPGTRSGDVPYGLKWPRRIWLILPDKISPSQHEAIKLVRAQLNEQADLLVSDARVKTIRGVNGQEFRLLSANEVAGIYRGAHVERTAILAFCGVKILLDISERPTNQGCMTLERFVRHKCSYTLVSRPEEAASALLSAMSWLDDTGCEGPRDPRCLPSAIFITEDFPLDTLEQRRGFVAHHKYSAKSSALMDALDRVWEIGPHHTRDLLQVAGTTLPVGFHWDVEADNKSSIIATGWETWKLPGRGYTNIHPNAYIRGGNATKTHPSATEKRSSGDPKTPRNKRKGKGQK
jgi:hypothetical protein